MSIKMPVFKKQTSFCQFWQFKSRKKSKWQWVGFLAVLPQKPLFCPLPSWLAFLCTIRWKVNCLSTKQIGVVHSREKGDDLTGWKMQKNLKKKKKKKRCGGGLQSQVRLGPLEYAHSRVILHSLLAACYLISGRQIFISDSQQLRVRRPSI